MTKPKKDESQWPSIKRPKEKSIPIKYDSNMGLYAPSIKEAKNKETKIPKTHYNS